jgi:hypothetical protein
MNALSGQGVMVAFHALATASWEGDGGVICMRYPEQRVLSKGGQTSIRRRELIPQSESHMQMHALQIPTVVPLPASKDSVHPKDSL